MLTTMTLSDPTGSSALLAAVGWLQGTLLGTVASTVAVIAVAAVGFMMLTGRIDLRRGVTVVIGCFILFGAPTIAGALRGTASEASAYRGPGPIYAPPVVAQPEPPRPVRTSPDFDPYSGASVPTR